MPAHRSITAMAIFFITTVTCYCTSATYNSSAEANEASVTGDISNSGNIIPGAYQQDKYFHLLDGKSVAVFANQTSRVGKVHLVDTLKNRGIDIKRIFSPEHGFRGTADAGEKVGNYTDAQTGIQVVSLYGSKRKPAAADVKDVDALIFDIQDVGVRFYTYISSL
ncbi:exo-beta-N-acetylmuramidase NamZ domain-containing protein, partial [Agriterribacter sp.]|uniref:exo-beta-N-acetylmuramidase NamZ domain-containing protein n=1 Tax=Agriterribacter sp. TaxID=2821509 RepID=UPI002CBC1F8E